MMKSGHLPYRRRLFVAVFCVVQCIWSETTVCGYIRKATDWTRARSPYIVQNDIYIPGDSRLSIEAGVTLRFTKPKPCKDEAVQLDWNDSMYTSIKVDGILYAKGTEQLPIIFESADAKNKGVGWDGIRIDNRTPSAVVIEFCHFKNAHVAIHSVSSHFSIRNSIFEKCNTGAKLLQFSNVHIINNTFVKNKSCGIYIEGSNPVILNNNFVQNLGYGVWSDSREQIKVHYNNFWENGDSHCYRCPTGTLKMVQRKNSGDSTDENHNMAADPVFLNSASHKKAMRRDIGVDTDTAHVKDKKMAVLEKMYRKMRKTKKVVIDHTLSLGKGPYALSKYSPLIHAGHPDAQFRNDDGTVNDMGAYGGPQKAEK